MLEGNARAIKMQNLEKRKKVEKEKLDRIRRLYSTDIFSKGAFEIFLDDIFNEYCIKAIDDPTIKVMTKQSFAKLISNLPKFISHKIFNAFKNDYTKSEFLSRDEFVKSLISIKYGSEEECIRMIFKMLDFKIDGVIEYDDLIQSMNIVNGLSRGHKLHASDEELQLLYDLLPLKKNALYIKLESFCKIISHQRGNNEKSFFSNIFLFFYGFLYQSINLFQTPIRLQQMKYDKLCKEKERELEIKTNSICMSNMINGSTLDHTGYNYFDNSGASYFDQSSLLKSRIVDVESGLSSKSTIATLSNFSDSFEGTSHTKTQPPAVGQLTRTGGNDRVTFYNPPHKSLLETDPNTEVFSTQNRIFSPTKPTPVVKNQSIAETQASITRNLYPSCFNISNNSYLVNKANDNSNSNDMNMQTNNIHSKQNTSLSMLYQNPNLPHQNRFLSAGSTFFAPQGADRHNDSRSYQTPNLYLTNQVIPGNHLNPVNHGYFNIAPLVPQKKNNNYNTNYCQNKFDPNFGGNEYYSQEWMKTCIPQSHEGFYYNNLASETSNFVHRQNYTNYNNDIGNEKYRVTIEQDITDVFRQKSIRRLSICESKVKT